MTVLDILNEASQALDASIDLNESMYQHNIVVRWNNGDLEGFSGTALSGARKAKESAEAKANRKAKMIKKEFSILDGKEFAQLDSAQKKRLKRDWELSQKMDESTELVQEEARKVYKFEYKGLDCYVRKWYASSGLNIYSAHNDDLDLYTKKYNTKEEAIKELKDLIDESIKDRDSVNEENEKPESKENEMPEEMKAKSKDIAKELVSALSVFLFAAEGLIGQEFESAKEAEDFIFSAMKSLRTHEKGTLTTMLRRFDRIGGERMANMFKRSLSKDLAK